MTDQRARVEWRDTSDGAGGIPVSLQFDDPYYSLEDGLAETRHVFLDGNELPARFQPDFHIAELGFGTGLNFLVTLAAWRASGATGTLQFTSFEAFPLPLADMIRAWNAFDGLPVDFIGDAGDTEVLPTQISGPDFELRIIVGDARDTLPAWDGRADAWYLDGFSPAKNPELWGEALMGEVAAHTVKGGTLATYTAAGFVRRALADAGFEVSRTQGFGRKRHMTRAVRT